jgi:hypothetical protein
MLKVPPSFPRQVTVTLAYNCKLISAGMGQIRICEEGQGSIDIIIHGDDAAIMATLDPIIGENVRAILRLELEAE